MSHKFEVSAEPRTVQGKSASRRLRRDGKVPAILYGAGEESVSLQINHNHLMLQSDHESFYSTIITLKVDGSADQQVVIKDMQRHPVRPVILHADFLRIKATDKLVLRIPVHFMHEDTCPAVKSGGGTIVRYLSSVEVTCLPKDLPEYVTVDMNTVGLGQTLHIGELPLPEGVAVYALTRGGDPMLPVVFIEAPRIVEEAPVVAAKGKKGAAKPAAKK